MSNNDSIWKTIEKMEKNYIRRQNEYVRLQNARIKEENAKIIEDNFNLVESWNKEIESKINKINNFHKVYRLEKFDVEKYYKSKLVPLVINDYVSLVRPNEKKLRKEIHCLKYNWLLEKIFKNRKNVRIQHGKEFEKEWEKLNIQYEKDEKENIEKYNKYKQAEILKNDNDNKLVNISKKKYYDNNFEEVNEVLKYFINVVDPFKESIGVKYLSVNINCESQCWVIELGFEMPDEIVPSIKKYNYLKTKNDTRQTFFTLSEKEKIFESIVFNSALYYTSVITYSFFDKIKNVIVNCYVDGINLATGFNEKKYLLSAMFDLKLLNHNNLSLIDSKVFFDSVNAKYMLPLMDLKKIVPYSNDKIDTLDYIDNNLNGFDFEKLSKSLLECNNFTDVIVTKASGDYGADVIVSKDEIKYAIQCKKYSSSVGVRAVQEVMASREMYKCHVGAILTNNYFTSNAIKLAEENKIILWNKVDLARMMENYNKKFNKENFSNYTDVLNSSENNISNSLDDEYVDLNDIDLRNELDNYQLLETNNVDNIEKDEMDLEDEMEAYGLEEHEKELVRKGEYNPWDFQTEGPFEDDDYYTDDI